MLGMKRLMICTVIYVLWSLLISYFLRTDTNQVYGYLAAWCTGLWIAALFNVDWKAVFSAFLMFLLVYVIDSFGKHFVFTFPKQTEDFTLVLFAFASSLPILINFVIQYCVKTYVKIQ